MRKKNSKFKLSMHAIFIFILSLILISIFSSVALSDNKQLYIYCLDEVDEGEEFSIVIYSYNESDEMLQNNVNIEFQGENYFLDEEILYLFAPPVEDDTDFLINASKSGFVSTNKNITVLKLDDSPSTELKLSIVPSSFLVNPDETFYVTIYYNNIPVEGATVFIQNSEDAELTNSHGIAFLDAPKEGKTILVKAKKGGYETGSIELTLNQAKSFWQGIIEHKLFPLFTAFIILLMAVVFVHLRQKRSIYSRAKQISDEKVVEKYTSSNDSFSNAKKYGYDTSDSSGELVHVRPSNDSKVEEIRITRPQKQREVVPVKPKKEDISRDSSQSNKNTDSEWFQGTDDIKYEIDKLTGEIDEDGMDKWFEGVGSLKDKVNERMKKKKKERNDEEY